MRHIGAEASCSEFAMAASTPGLARGRFEVRMLPQRSEDLPGGDPVGRLLVSKQFHGGLEGSSEGQMLTATTRVEGSAGYVAMERVSGTLNGRRGRFVLQHSGVMMRGDPRLTVEVVPDSGEEELTGLAGTMEIVVAEGEHSYEFRYTLPGRPETPRPEFGPPRP
jgi:hypothetical protein